MPGDHGGRARRITSVTIGSMIVACPSCATRYDLPPGSGAEDGAMIRCAACHHSWIEGRAVEITELVHHPVSLIEDHSEDDREVARIADEARQARARFEARRRQRRRRLAGWAGLAAASALPIAAAMALPDRVVGMAPAMMYLYEAAGVPVNVRGFEIRNVENQSFAKDGVQVLAIKGNIINITGTARKVPSMRFVLRGPDKRELYAWTLASVGTKALEAGEATSFVTRVAAPPQEAENIEIRFARRDELATTARP
jgi:predicted Zn finger-like uncharacterized protein